jgi:hypothetical protein
MQVVRHCSDAEQNFTQSRNRQYYYKNSRAVATRLAISGRLNCLALSVEYNSLSSIILFNSRARMHAHLKSPLHIVTQWEKNSSMIGQ